MGTKDRAAVNRRNALQSTGPTTPEGRAVSRMNALRHGLTAKSVLLPDERAEDFVAFAENLRTDLDPVGAMEEVLAERIVAAAWRLRRVLRVEASLYSRALEDDPFGVPRGSDVGLAFIRDGNGANAFGKLARYESTLERGLTSALHELQRLQAARGGREVAPPVVVDVNLFGVPDSSAT
jgi:hypothetical protein